MANDSRLDELKGLQNTWIPLFVIGVIMVILGILAFGSLYISTIATIYAISIILFIAALAQLAHALTGRNLEGFFLHLIISILYGLAAIFLFTNPVAGSLALTLVLGFFFLFTGLFKALYAITSKIDQKIWVFVSGAISFILGIFILRHWPYTGLFIIGLYIAIELFITGITWIGLSLAARDVTHNIGTTKNLR